MKDFLHIADFTSAELQYLLELALRLKREWRRGSNRPVLKGQVLGMVFQKPSLRTRVSFDVAMRQLGGDALYLSPGEIGLGGREAVPDVARVLSRYVQAILARTFQHQHILELAHWASVPVINGLSDYNHPCQALSDALTIFERLGALKSRSVAFIGDGNNVSVSMLHISARLGANFTLASPEGYDMPAQPAALGRQMAEASGARVTFTRDPHDAVRGADVVYTDTWTSMGQEAETEKRRQVFPPYQLNARLLAEAAPGAIVLHCLPAHRGEEITDEVMDGPQSAVFDQAENRLHAQKAILHYLLVEHGTPPAGKRPTRSNASNGHSKQTAARRSSSKRA